MDLNTCRKQWKEQRKQNKIENLKIHSTKLSKDVFTLHMQVTTANKPGWTLGGYEAVDTYIYIYIHTQWPENNLSYSKAQDIGERIPQLWESCP